MATAARSGNKTKSNGPVTSKDIESSLAQVKKDISELTNTLSEYGKGKVGSARESANARSDELLESSEQAIAELRKQVNELSDRIEGRVREKPFQSLAIAAGVGVLLSLIARR